MRIQSRSLDALLPRIRREILAATLLRPERWWFMADLARHLGVTPSSLQRELASLVSSGILRKRREGRQVYYQPDPTCPFFPDLRGLLVKTVGLRDVLHDALAPLGDRIARAFVHGSIARGDEIGASDIDLLVVGSVTLAEVSAALEDAERRLGREVNPTVYSISEVSDRLRSGSHFLQQVLSGPRLPILGNDDDLEGAAR